MLGSPIGHSLSPALHRAAYAVLDLDWTYDAVEVDEAGLPAFLAALDASWRGLSLTMPLKRAVLPLLDSVQPLAEQVGAANTVVLDAAVSDGTARRHGSNTDVPGLVAALAEGGVRTVRRVLLLGAGATAASAVAAVAQLAPARDAAPEVVVAVRDPSRAARLVRLAHRFGVDSTVTTLDALDDGMDTAGGRTAGGTVDLVVSTLPAGGVGGHLAATTVGLLAPGGAVCDVVYDGWPTPLARAASTAGAVVVSGTDLLVHQALGQITAFTGRQVPVGVLRAALPGSLGEPPDQRAHRTLT